MLCFIAMSAICFSTSAGNTAPVGLDGVLRMIILVFGVMAASTSAGSRTKLSSNLVGTYTGTPPARRTHASYETQEGSARMTSSPGSMYASMVMKMACLHGVTRTLEASHGTLLFSRVMSAMAFLSSGMPMDGV